MACDFPGTLDKVLIVGYGYAGRRFHRVFDYLAATGAPVRLAGVCDIRKERYPDDVSGFNDLSHALEMVQPTVIAVTVNEKEHGSVYAALADHPRSLVLSEKPLTTDMASAKDAVRHLDGHCFFMNLVERYSPVVQQLRTWLKDLGPVEIVRIESHWGKYRIGDRRPTFGVLSELIHPIDLVNFLFPERAILVETAQGVHSDYSPWAGPILETVDVLASIGSAPLLVHSSFAWPSRRRTVSSLVRSPAGLFQIDLALDDPHWDADALLIRTVAPSGRRAVGIDSRFRAEDIPAPIRGVAKVLEFVSRSLAAWRSGSTDSGLVGIETAAALQATLDRVGRAAHNRSARAGFNGWFSSMNQG